MSQEIAKPTNTSVGMPQEKNIYEQYAEEANTQRIVGELLKFSKGEWLSGKDGDPVDEEATFVASPETMEVGWIRWWENKPTDYLMGKISDGYRAPLRSTLGDTDKQAWEFDEASGSTRDPWQRSNNIILMETRTRQLYTFAGSSKGAMAAVAKLMGIYGKHIRLAPTKFPVLALEVSSYKHSNKAFGKIFTPTFKVVGWAERTEFDQVLNGAMEMGDEVEDEPEEEARPHPTDYPAKPQPKKATPKRGYKSRAEEPPFD